MREEILSITKDALMAIMEKMVPVYLENDPVYQANRKQLSDLEKPYFEYIGTHPDAECVADYVNAINYEDMDYHIWAFYAGMHYAFELNKLGALTERH